jgi:hypothetical protein
MLPLAHVGLTLASFGFLRKKGLVKGRPKYAKLALASLLPDLIDKPLAIFVFPESKSALLFSHTLILHLAVWAWTALKNKFLWPYALAFSGHLLLDRIWEFPQTFLFPFKGWSFHKWRDVGSPQAFGRAYFEVMGEHPELLVGEVLGFIALLWFCRERVRGKV